MKKLILSIAVLVALSTTSCKKTYECTCEETTVNSRETVMPEYKDDVDSYNDAQQEAQTDALTESHTTVTTFEKTTKSNANQSCASSVETNKEDVPDGLADMDSDGNLTEPAYTQVQKITRDCEVEKSK